MAGQRAGSSAISTTRTSKTSWLPDSSHPTVRNLEARIAMVGTHSSHYLLHHIFHSQITGLATNSEKDDAELLQVSTTYLILVYFQVANYMNGGHYNPHHDYVMKEKAPEHLIYLPESSLYIGDRVATWMFYMSDVGEGGRTVFPRIGAAVKPKAGTAVFWYDRIPDIRHLTPVAQV